MAWLAVNKVGWHKEFIYEYKPTRRRESDVWESIGRDYYSGEFMRPTIPLPEGSIKKLIGRELTWEDEPVEI